MRVVVTGASGNVGTAVLTRLRACASVSELIALARRPPDAQDPADQDSGVRVQWHAVDVSRGDLEPVLRGADAVVHLAWRFHPNRDHRETWQANVLGSMRVAEAAAGAGVGVFVHASSVGAYSPGPHVAGRADTPVDERWPTHALPTAAYGRQKSYLERFFDHFEDRNALRVVRLRSAFVFQPIAAPEQRRIFAGPFAPTALIASGRLPAVPLPRGLRVQAVAAADLAVAYEAALLRPVSGPFNVAAEPVLGHAELGAVLGARVVAVPDGLARRAFAAAYALRLVPTEPGLLELALSLPIMDTTRARRELGWAPRETAADAVESLLAGWRDPRGGPTPTLAADAGGPARLGELATGVGARE